MTLAKTVTHRFSHLVTAGCSFTTVEHENYSSSWPEYLRDRMDIKNVYTLGRYGAGNRQISSSLVWFLENHQLDPAETLVIVMFSGNDRDDEIVDLKCVKEPDNPLTVYNYTSSVVGATTGGLTTGNFGNTRLELGFKKVMTQIKSLESRAVENYLHVINTYNYLENNRYPMILTRFLDTSQPSRSRDFDIAKYLPETLGDRIDNILDKDLTNIYTWCLKNDLLSVDDFHPDLAGYLSWTDNHLIPYLIKKFSLEYIKSS